MNYIMINWKTESELIFFSSPQNAKYKWDRGFLRRDHISLFSIPEEHFFQAISPIHNMNSMRRRTVSKQKEKWYNFHHSKNFQKPVDFSLWGKQCGFPKLQYLRILADCEPHFAMQNATIFFQLPFFRNVLPPVEQRNVQFYGKGLACLP